MYTRHSQTHTVIVYSVVHKVNFSEFQKTQFEIFDFGHSNVVVELDPIPVNTKAWGPSRIFC